MAPLVRQGGYAFGVKSMITRVKLSNRQRKLCLDTAQWAETCERLLMAVFENVRRQRPDHLLASHVKLIESQGAVCLQFVSNKTIRKLNKQWRHKDYATDVLSFPLIFEESGASFLPDLAGTTELELGDIVISVEKANEQAAEYGHSLERELAFLFVHGLLHVLGFDHETAEQEKDMFSRQTAVLNCLGFIK
jgi:probable rRNA maturation factor